MNIYRDQGWPSYTQYFQNGDDARSSIFFSSPFYTKIGGGEIDQIDDEVATRGGGYLITDLVTSGASWTKLQ